MKTERKQSVEPFREALGDTELTEEWKELLPWGMWLAHLGMILFFLRDQSEGQRKSHDLVDLWRWWPGSWSGQTLRRCGRSFSHSREKCWRCCAKGAGARKPEGFARRLLEARRNGLSSEGALRTREEAGNG